MRDFFVAIGVLLVASLLGALFRTPINWVISSFERLYVGERGSTSLWLTWGIALVASCAAAFLDVGPNALRLGIVVLAVPVAIAATLIRSRQRHLLALPNRLSRVTRGFTVVLGIGMILTGVLLGFADWRTFWGMSLGQLAFGVGFVAAGALGNASIFHRIVFGFPPPEEPAPLANEEL